MSRPALSSVDLTNISNAVPSAGPAARELVRRLQAVEDLARRHATAASNPGAHALAAAIVRICEGNQ